MDKDLGTAKIDSEVKKLNQLITEWIGPDRVTREDRIIFVKLKKKDDGKEFLLKIVCSDQFPLEPPNYFFVNPKTKEDDSAQYWPTHNQDAFKSNENPRWICIAGTLEYKKHHNEHIYNPNINSINQTVFHIFREINGWKRSG